MLMFGDWLQSFINKSFEKIISTDHALRLLHQFEYILNRDSLKVRFPPWQPVLQRLVSCWTCADFVNGAGVQTYQADDHAFICCVSMLLFCKFYQQDSCLPATSVI